MNYAHKWAYKRNPDYYNYDPVGGDCTNFASQCVFSGDAVMNYTPDFGWYYIDANRKSPAWSGVEYFYSFIINNKDAGPFGREAGIDEIQPGDFVQMRFGGQFQHTPFVVAAGSPANYDNILVAAHTFDCDYTPLSSFDFSDIRFVKILGVRRWS